MTSTFPIKNRETVAIALSRFFSTKAPLSGGTGRLMLMLEEISRSRLKNEMPALDIDWASLRGPSVEAELRRKGLSFAGLQRDLQDRRRRDGEEASLPEDLLQAFIPLPYWVVVSDLIDDGPSVAGRRVELAMTAQSRREVPPTASRPEGGPIASGTLHSQLVITKRLLAILAELGRRTDRPELGAWTSAPVIDFSTSNPDQVTDTTAPSLRLLRQVIATHDRKIEAALGCPVHEQAAFIRARPTTANLSLFRLLRQRMELGILCCLGLRVGALTRLKVGDVQRRRPRFGGGEGPALAVRPQKTLGDGVVRHKPIPAGLLWCIDAFLAFVEVSLGAPLPDDNPLLISTLSQPRAALSSKSIRQRLAQRSRSNHVRADGEVVTTYSPPLLPRPGGRTGYSPHTLRAAATQIIRSRAGAQWLEENRDRWDDPRLAAGEIALPMIAEVLLDHAVQSDALGYSGASKELDRERLAGYGAEITWALLTSDAGARKAPDLDAFRQTLRQRLAAEAELEQVDRIISDTFQRTLAGELADGKALIEINRLRSDETRIRDRLSTVKEHLKELRDPSMFVVLDDDAEPPTLGFDDIEREVLGGNSDYARLRYEPVRDWVTPKELAQILDSSEATVRRWLRGEFPRDIEPWDPEAPPVDDSFGPKRRRLLVDGLNKALFGSELMKEKLAETLARWPEGWSRAAIEGRA